MDSKLEQYIEDYRHKISALLMDTDEDHPIECEILLGEDYSCGLSTLEMLWITKCYQQPGEGILWFYVDGGGWVEFDDIDIRDYYNIYKALVEYHENKK